MKTRLNLATVPLENHRPFFAGAAAAGVPALVLCAVFAGVSYRDWRDTRDRRAEVAQLRADIRSFEKQRAELEKFFASSQTRRVMERAAFLNGLIDQRSFPWTKIFVDLERELPAGVRVISLSPSLQGGKVGLKMSVAALNDRGKLEFLKTLEESPEFSKLLVLSESRAVRSEGAPEEIHMDLEAQYAAGAPALGGLASGDDPAPKPATSKRTKR